jgi:hypothetical protein
VMPVSSGLCSPRSVLSCGSRRCGRHRTAHSEHSRRLPLARACALFRVTFDILQVVHEIGGALTTSRAVARLHGQTTSFVDGVVVSVGTRRLLFFLAMQALRLAVAVLLCYGGAFFIGKSIKLSDLILNCIALEVRSSSRHAVRGCGVRAHQVHVGRSYARWDAVRRTSWFVRAQHEGCE